MVGAFSSSSMSSFLKVFDLIFGSFSNVWNAVTDAYSAFLSIFDTFKSFFDNLLDNLGIYDVLISSFDTVTSLATSLSQYVSNDSFVGTICSFVALDTLFAIVSTVLAATVGACAFLVSLVFVTTIPVLLGWLAVKGVLRVIRICSAGIVDP